MSLRCLQEVDRVATNATFCAARFLLTVRILTGLVSSAMNVSLDRIAMKRPEGREVIV
jgi:hypothetical protein